jgi:long-chain fatty acid transport protein
VAVLPARLDLEFRPDGGEPPVDGDRGPDATLASVFASRQLDSLTWGLGVHSYLGTGFDYGPGWTGQRMLEEARLRTINVTPALAWRLSDRLDVGIAADLQHADVSATIGVSNDAAIYGPPAGYPDGRLRLAGDSWAVGGSVGLLYRADADTRFGLTWLAGPRHDTDLELQLQDLHPVPAMLLAAAGPPDLVATMPQQVLLGAVHQLAPAWQVAGSVGWQDWSSFGDAHFRQAGGRARLFPHGLDDTWHVALGTRFGLAPRWTVAAGAAYDTDPSNEAPPPLYFPVSEQWRLALGVEFEPRPGLQLRLGYSQLRQGAVRIDAAYHPLPLPGMTALPGQFAPSRVHVLTMSAAGAW